MTASLNTAQTNPDDVTTMLARLVDPMGGFSSLNVNNTWGQDYVPQVTPMALPTTNLGSPSNFPGVSLPNFTGMSRLGVANTGTLPPSNGAGMPFLSTKDQQGWGSMALGGAQALGGMYMGMKQYGIAKDTLNESKKQFSMNFDAQRRATNAALEDRQRRRVAENPNHAVAVDEYMRKNGIQ